MSEATKTHAVTLIPGDGIGPEVSGAVVRILEATGVKFAWERHCGRRSSRLSRRANTSRQELLESIERNKLALKGPVTTPIGGGFVSINVKLRQAIRAVRQLSAD